jgi:hypothetical protein
MPRRTNTPAILYEYDRDTGLFTRMTPNGPAESVTLDQLSNGALDSDGQRIYSTANRFNNWQLRRDGTFLLTKLDGDKYSFHNEISTSEINTTSPVAAIRGLHGDFIYTLPNGVQRHIYAENINAARTGSSLWALGPKGDVQKWISLLNGPDGDAARQAAIEAGYRLADEEETINRALEGYLMRAHEDLLNDMIATGEVDDEGKRIVRTSQAAAYLGKLYASEMTAYISTVMFAPVP